MQNPKTYNKPHPIHIAIIGLKKSFCKTLKEKKIPPHLQHLLQVYAHYANEANTGYLILKGKEALLLSACPRADVAMIVACRHQCVMNNGTVKSFVGNEKWYITANYCYQG